ncbi:MAG: response regulator [Desulfarculus sp.]|nr:MAG: response regulator [Desulfarculus sp.]
MEELEPKEPIVLVVDDESSIREGCLRVLSAEGYLVRVASSGETALELAGGERPDLVLLDLKMPGLGGMAILDELNHLAPEAVKVVISAYATVSTALESMRHGAWDFLAKPFTPDELRLTARRALERQRWLLKQGQAQQRFLEMVSGKLHAPLQQARQDLESLVQRLAQHPSEQELAKRALARLEVVLALAEKWETA